MAPVEFLPSHKLPGNRMAGLTGPHPCRFKYYIFFVTNEVQCVIDCFRGWQIESNYIITKCHKTQCCKLDKKNNDVFVHKKQSC